MLPERGNVPRRSMQTGSNEQNDGAPGIDWAGRYRASDTPWDLGGPHPELSTRLQDGRLAPSAEGGRRALVPGVGRGHDAIALARRGWSVTAIDLVEPVALELAPVLEKLGGRCLAGDALTIELEGEFDLIWDHTFFCAIPPVLRAPWGARARTLLRPGGRYVALAFPVGKPAEEGGPPFGMTPAEVLAVLGASFREIEQSPVARPVARRTWREVWVAAERAALKIAD